MTDTTSTLVLDVSTEPAKVKLEAFGAAVAAVRENLDLLFKEMSKSPATGVDQLALQLKASKAETLALRDAFSQLEAQNRSLMSNVSSGGQAIVNAFNEVKLKTKETSAAVDEVGTSFKEFRLAVSQFEKQSFADTVFSKTLKGMSADIDQLKVTTEKAGASLTHYGQIIRGMSDDFRLLKTPVNESTEAMRASYIALQSLSESTQRAGSNFTTNSKAVREMSESFRVLQGATKASVADLNAYYKSLEVAGTTAVRVVTNIDALNSAMNRGPYANATRELNQYKHSVEQLNEYYRNLERVDNAIAKVNAAEAGWQKTQSQRVSAAVAALTAENKGIQSLTEQYRQLEAQQRATTQARITTGGFSDYTKLGTTGSSLLAQRLDPGVTASYSQATSAAKALTAETDKLTSAHTALHSAARGASGALGGLWMTYSQDMSPLMIAFGTVSAVSATIKEMTNLEVTLSHVANVSRDTGETFGQLNERLLALYEDNKLVQSPTEAAEALKELVYAGFSADEAFKALIPTLKFAANGELEMAEAADVVQQVMHAYNLTAADTTHITDVMAAGAAASATTISEMSAAMKQGSVVGGLYKVSLEDTVVGLAALAKVGIEGTAAGTALKNFYKEMTSPMSKKAQETITQFGLEFFKVEDGVKKLKDLPQIVQELRDKFQSLSEVDSQAFFKAINDMANERGVKFLSQAITMAKSDWDGFYQTIVKDSAGFNDRLYGMLSETTWGEFTSAVQSAKVAFITSMQGMDGELKNLGRSLGEFVRSDDFKQSLKGIVEGLSTTIQFLREYGKEIATMVAGYAAFKIGRSAVMLLVTGMEALLTVTGRLALVTGISSAAGLGASMMNFTRTLVAVGTGAATTATGLTGVAGAVSLLKTGLAFLAGPVGIIGGLLTAGATLWLMWGNRASEAAENARRNIDETRFSIDTLQMAVNNIDWSNLGSSKAYDGQINEALKKRSELVKGANALLADASLANPWVSNKAVNKLEIDPKGDLVRKADGALVDITILAKGAREEISKVQGEIKQLMKVGDVLDEARTKAHDLETNEAARRAKEAKDNAKAFKPSTPKVEGSSPYTQMIQGMEQYLQGRKEEYEIGNKLTESQKKLAEVEAYLSAEKFKTNAKTGERIPLLAKESAALEKLKADLQPMAALDQLYSNLETDLKSSEQAYRKNQEAIKDEASAREQSRKIMVDSGQEKEHIANLLSEVDSRNLLNQYLKNNQAEVLKVQQAQTEYMSVAEASGKLESKVVTENLAALQLKLDVLKQESKAYETQIELLAKKNSLAEASEYNKLNLSQAKKEVDIAAKLYDSNKKAQSSLIVLSEKEKAVAEARSAAEGHYTELLMARQALMDETKAKTEELYEYVKKAEKEGLAGSEEAKTKALAMSELLKKMGVDYSDLSKRMKEASDKQAEFAAQMFEDSKWSAAYTKIESTLTDGITDGIMNGFKDGYSFIDSFISVLKEEFRKTVLTPMVQPIVSGIANSFASMLVPGATQAGGSFLSSMGSSAAGSAAGGYLSSIGGSIWSGMTSSVAGSAATSAGLNMAAVSGMGEMGVAAEAASSAYSATAASMSGAASSLMAAAGVAAAVIGIAYLINGKAWAGDPDAFMVQAQNGAANAYTQSTRTAFGQIGFVNGNASIGATEGVGPNGVVRNGYGETEGLPADAMKQTLQVFETLDAVLASSLSDSQIQDLSDTMVGWYEKSWSASGEKVTEWIARRYETMFDAIDTPLGQLFATFTMTGENVSGVVGAFAILNEVLGENVNESLMTLMETMDLTAENIAEVAPAFVQLAEYLSTDIMGEATRQIELAGRSAWQVMSDGASALTALAGSFDGSISGAQQLGNATATLFQQELSMIGQIEGMMKSIPEQINGSIDSIRMSVMNDSDKYDYLRTQMDTMHEELSHAVDPSTISGLVSSIDNMAMQAWQMLSPENQQQHSGEFQQYLTDLSALATERLSAAEDVVKNQHAEIVSAIQTGMGAAAGEMSAAASTMASAAGSIPSVIDVNSHVDVNVSFSADVPGSAEVGVNA